MSDTSSRRWWRILFVIPLLAAFAVHLVYAAIHDQNYKRGDFPGWDIALLLCGALVLLSGSLAVRLLDSRKGGR